MSSPLVLPELPQAARRISGCEAPDSDEIEVSVVMPCLNEADTLAHCIRTAQRALFENALSGEVIVADNGSTDGSVQFAEDVGARVVDVKPRGYGNALLGGIAAARGRYVIMGDADQSYDFSELPKFVAALRAGADLVQGCRLPSGGGTVLPQAMPFLHRWWGNPMFSLLARLWFGAPIHDVYCGLRGFRKEFQSSLNQRCTGMEFATEMIIKASSSDARIVEVPVTLHPDGRRSHPPHLKTFRDGWRTLRFFLLCSPRWLFFIPGVALILLGFFGYGLALPNVALGGIRFDAHTLLFASLFAISGYQTILFAVFAKSFAANQRLLPSDAPTAVLQQWLSLERGIAIAAALLVGGALLLLAAVNQWRLVHFGPLDYSHTMRFVIPGATLTTLGLQTLFSSFFLSILEINRR
jgi:glycosyltransferase involved in cell wall biosynthesis